MRPSPLLVVACLLLVYAFCAGQTPGQNSNNLPFEEARQMAVSVHTFGGFGSGVWIGNHGYLATCYHVVKAAQDNPIIVSHELTPAGKLDELTVSIAALNPEADVVILKANASDLHDKA
jgi:S1-C subfamily serine protease